MTAPCKNCPYRAVGCHSYCEPFKAFRASVEEANQRRREQLAAEDAEITGMKRRAKPRDRRKK